MIAALFVDEKGCYSGMSNVDVWGERRDARLYDGPYPVVAHPPCARWCRLAGLVEARWGHKRGEDDGCFSSALASVRRWGGVLEHPAYSDAWAAFDLNRPPVHGGWVNADFEGGWTCHVEQGLYGHPAHKATWLYAIGCDLPSMRWGRLPSDQVRAIVSGVGCTRNFGNTTLPRMDHGTSSATPKLFQDILISMAMNRPSLFQLSLPLSDRVDK